MSRTPEHPDTDLARGIVVANYGRHAEVLTADGARHSCLLAADLGLTPVAGDRVQFRDAPGGAHLTAVEPRVRVIQRAGRRAGETRVLAAHVDVMLIVSAVEPPFKEGLVDRYLVTAGVAGIAPVVVLNKIDLDSGRCAERAALYAELGYATFPVSAKTGEGIGELAAGLADRTSVLVGQSGVGKSSLLMALIPGVSIPTASVSSYSGKGVHTTRTARLWTGPGGLRIIDSPGIRAFGLGAVAPGEVRRHFVEFLPLAPRCRFRDCMHLRDEGCAVRAAAEAGEIPPGRYRSYVRIVASLG